MSIYSSFINVNLLYLHKNFFFCNSMQKANKNKIIDSSVLLKKKNYSSVFHVLCNKEQKQWKLVKNYVATEYFYFIWCEQK